MKFAGCDEDEATHNVLIFGYVPIVEQFFLSRLERVRSFV